MRKFYIRKIEGSKLVELEAVRHIPHVQKFDKFMDAVIELYRIKRRISEQRIYLLFSKRSDL